MLHDVSSYGFSVALLEGGGAGVITLQISETASLLGGELIGPDVRFTGVSTDSRAVPSGALFIALQGPRFDGHDFVASARKQGAVAALVQRRVESLLPQIRVADTRLALGHLGAAWRDRFPGTVVALTGSNGKTTVKEMITAILRVDHPVMATQGNFNNDIGVPLTLLRLAQEPYAVVEMGANHEGDIRYLCQLARPDVALVTNAGPAHLEGFGDLDGVARGKGEIFQGLGPRGIGVVNRDDVYAEYWSGLLSQRRLIDFGLERPAQVQGRVVDVAPTRQLIELSIAGHTVPVELPLAGYHNARNALAAAAVSYAAGASITAIQQGLKRIKPVAGRLQPLVGLHGCVLIHDAYNANPSSLAAALTTVGGAAQVKWLVLGDMAELGPSAEACHRQAGVEAREAGFQRCYGLGDLTRHMVTSFGAGAAHFASADALIDTLVGDLGAASSKPTLLIKGSRSMRMERVVNALTAVAPAPVSEKEKR